MISPVVRLVGVSKRYKAVSQRPFLAREMFRHLFGRRRRGRVHEAVREISLSVPGGQAVGVVGANGSGKSTLLSLIAGTSYATTGEVAVHGRVGPMLDLGVGFHPDLTGAENIYLNASLLGFAREDVDERLQSIVNFAEVGDYLDVSMRTYSTGMVARLGFAVLAHMDLDILVVDEAFSVGDRGFQRKCERAMRKYLERGTTLLLASHDLDLVKRICDRVIWLEDGSLRADGSPEDVLREFVREVPAAAR